MSVNKLALIRYKTINECLRNRYRKWTLEDLIDKVSQVLYESEGINSGVSRRTIQADLQLMRSNRLGYNAPIVVIDKRYYTYSQADYSITNMPINDTDVEKLKEVVGMLKQFNGFNYFEEMSEMVAKLENNLYKSSNVTGNYIQFEDNKLLKGLGFINPLYQAILKKQSLMLEYKSFKAIKAISQVYYPYLLKEYRNRWFLVCRSKKSRAIMTLALDRIVGFEYADAEKFYPYEGVDFDRYFSDVIGVTKNETDRAQRVILEIDKYNAPYILTKPLHASQQILKEDDHCVIIRIDVVLNFELEREILGYGEMLKVLAPRNLANRICRRIGLMQGKYVDPSARA